MFGYVSDFHNDWTIAISAVKSEKGENDINIISFLNKLRFKNIITGIIISKLLLLLITWEIFKLCRISLSRGNWQNPPDIPDVDIIYADITESLLYVLSDELLL